MRISRLKLARINHILIPESRIRRDQLRASRLGRLLAPAGTALGHLTFEGASLSILLLVLFLFIFYIELSSSFVFWGFSAGFLLVSLAYSRRTTLAGVDLDVLVEGPAFVGDELEFRIRIRNSTPHAFGPLRISLPFLPWDGSWSGRPLHPTSLEPLGTCEVRAQGRFYSRGWHDLDPVGISRMGFGGLTSGVRIESGVIRFRVDPRPAEVESLSGIFLERVDLCAESAKSRGRRAEDFLGLREYRVGDPLRNLHARTSARLGKPMVIERDERTGVVIGIVVDLVMPGLDELGVEELLSLAMGGLMELERRGLDLELLLPGGHAGRSPISRGGKRGARGPQYDSVGRCSDDARGSGDQNGYRSSCWSAPRGRSWIGIGVFCRYSRTRVYPWGTD